MDKSDCAFLGFIAGATLIAASWMGYYTGTHDIDDTKLVPVKEAINYLREENLRQHDLLDCQSMRRRAARTMKALKGRDNEE